MSDPATITTAITVATAIIVGILGFMWRSLSELRKELTSTNGDHGKRLVRLESHDDVIWTIYGLEGVRASRDRGYTSHQSPEYPTGKWREVIPEYLQDDLLFSVEVLAEQREITLEDALRALWTHYLEDFAVLTEGDGLTARELTGILVALWQRQRLHHLEHGDQGD
jgi:hypothetical protein